MDDLSQKSPVFTGLILLTGIDAPGIAQGLFHSLSDFSVQIDDVEQIVISGRLVLTVLITLNPAHQSAIEVDLAQYAQTSETDIATIFSEQSLIQVDKNRVGVHIVSKKMHPKALSTLTSGIVAVNANIESISRTQSEPTGILFVVTGTTQALLASTIEGLEFESELETRVYEL
jgi:phosphoserine phosphatase